MGEIVYYGAGANLRDFEEEFVRETGISDRMSIHELLLFYSL